MIERQTDLTPLPTAHPNRRSVLALLAASLLYPPGRAAAIGTTERLRLRIAVNGNFFPLSAVDDAGTFSGVLIEEMSLIGANAGILFEFHDLPWARAQSMVRFGELDGFCTVRTPSRQEYALFADTPIYSDRIIVIYRADDRVAEAAQSLKDLDGLRIGEPLGNAWFETLLSGREVTWVNDIPNLLSMIAAKRIDAALVGNATGIGMLRQHPDRARLRTHALPLLPQDGGFHIGLRKSLPNVAAIIADIERAIQTVGKDFAPIQLRYLGGTS